MGQRSQIYIRYNISGKKGLIAYIDSNAILMTKEEAEEFVNADYSYLFSNIQKN